MGEVDTAITFLFDLEWRVSAIWAQPPKQFPLLVFNSKRIVIAKRKDIAMMTIVPVPPRLDYPVPLNLRWPQAGEGGKELILLIGRDEEAMRSGELLACGRSMDHTTWLV